MNARSPDPAYIPDVTDRKWRIDPRRSSIGFETKNLYGLQTVRGRFTEFDGSLDLRTDPAIELSVEAGSLTTRNPRRDKHLSSPDFFDAEAQPTITFTSTNVRLDGDILTIHGALTAAGRTVLIELEGTIRHEEDELLFDAYTLVDHRQLGMTWNALGMIRGLTRLTAHIRLISD
jgi:polyisoprenoid-binding protein YceI